MSLGRSFRLPRDVHPIRYAIHLDIDLAAWTFAGRERCDIVLDAPRRELVLHSADLEVSRVVAEKGASTLLPDVSFDTEAGAMTLRFSDLIPAGGLTLQVEFAGRIRSDLKALYRSTRGAERYAVAIVFPAEARRVFPCFDEPTFKARFALELTAPARLTAIANAELLEKTDAGGGRAKWRFAETPPLSTYLVAFLVGPFEGTDVIHTKSGVPVRVWLPSGLANEGEYARDAHRRAVEWLEAYTGIAYPYDKAEGVGVPDFPAGAMENPGAITYRLDLLAADPGKTSASTLKACVSVVSHELTHMWWGDLVTLAWWDDIWLNESFATFVGHKAEHAVHPEWDVWRDFVIGTTRGLALDSLVATHAIHSDAASAEEALQRFDAISYQKGAAVLRMIEGYLGEEIFQKGVRLYLERFRESNATAADFWRALDETSGQDVTRIASVWINEPGHPIVELRLIGTNRIGLRQRRFVLDGDLPPSPQRWPVPLVLRSAMGVQRTLLTDLEGTTEIADGAWVYPNAGAMGFYRFALDEALSTRIRVNLSQLDPAERLLLLDNEWALVLCGESTIADLVALLASLRSEDDRAVLAVVFEQLRWLVTHSSSAPVRPALGTLARDFFGPVLERLGWEPVGDESADDRELRPMAIHALGSVADAAEVRDEAGRRVRAHLDGRRQSPDVIGACLAVAAIDGDLALHTRYVEALGIAARSDPQDEHRIRDALAAFSDPRATDATIVALFDGTIRDQDLPGILFAGFRNVTGRQAYWRAFRSRYAERIAPLEGLVRQGAVASVAQLTPDPLATEADQFLAGLADPDMGEVVARTRESLRLSSRAARRIAADLPGALAISRN
jgi:puromycin-sensitive aminopeptidase